MSYAVSPAHAQLAQPPCMSTARRPPAFDADLVALLPSLKAYALSLCRNGAMADDLVQSASAGAMANAQQFQVGSTMRAWLFTILRNQYFSILRKRRHEIEDADGRSADKLSLKPTQNDSIDLADAIRAVRTLTPKHSELLMLLGPGGLSYDEAAKRSGCAVGTIKSRANRARRRLADTLSECGG